MITQHWSRPRRFTALVTLTIAAGLALSACSAPTASTSSSNAGAVKPKVLVIFPFLGDQAYVRQQLAAEAEIKKHPEIDFKVVAGTKRSDVDFFTTAISNASAQGYAAVALNTGGTAKQIAPAINQAIRDGVKFVSFDGAIPDSPGMSANISYSNAGAAALAGEEFLKLLPAGGNIGVIRCLQGLPDTDAFVDGFKKAIEGSKLAVVAEGDAKCDPAQSRTLAENMLTAHSDLVGIYDSVDVSAQGTLQAVEAAKAKVIIGSVGGQLYGAEAVAANSPWKVTVPYPFEEMGQQAVGASATLATGGSVEKEIVIDPLPALTQTTAAAWVSRLKSLGLKDE